MYAVLFLEPASGVDGTPEISLGTPSLDCENPRRGYNMSRKFFEHLEPLGGHPEILIRSTKSQTFSQVL